MTWQQYFPYNKPRKQQVDAIEGSIRAWKEGKKFVIIEAGTGVGKSAIGLTVAKYINANSLPGDGYKSGSHFLTTQKILQNQYVKDFGRHGMLSINSSANFQCRYHKKNTCAESLRAVGNTEKGSSFWNACAFNCNYKKAKRDYMEGKVGVTNFPYFLAETTYAGKLSARQTLVIDECHNAETQLSKFIEVSVSERFSKQLLKLDMPISVTQFQAYNWLKDVYAPKLFSHVKHMKAMLSKYSGLKEKLQEFQSIAKQFELLDKHACKIERFLQIYEKNNWVFNEVPAIDRKMRKFEFKPIDVAPFANDMLFKYGEFNILMSATIISKENFCKLLGIQEDQAEFLKIPSPFPLENRPVIYSGVGKMSANDINYTLPKLRDAVVAILQQHKNEKGIIHCHSYKIAWYLKKNIKNSRLLIHDSENRDHVLARHASANTPTVLLSPSMTEGVDLKDDLSRFQIICKVPFPYLGDKLIRKKMNKWKWWYDMQTAKTIIQSTGRSVRNEKDTAVTYILDSSWARFYDKNKNLFGPEFTC